MSPGLVWSNIVSYSLQVGLLIGVAALAPTAVRLRSPRARLAYWHLLLAACLLLPAVRPWREQVIVDNVTITSRIVAVAPSQAGSNFAYSPAEIALGIILVGAVARLGWLAVGFWKLGRYRHRSRPFRTALPWESRAELRIADDVSSPVTFGVRHPVILLPPQFPALDARAQQAILCHELLHVDRRDWLFTVAEEIVRAAFWFHPAIWWLLGEIQLAREQAVDRRVIELTQARDEYVDALLAIAGAKPALDLAPAPLFLRKRHLKHRVVSILKESRMSRKGLLSALAASVCVLVAACWLVTNTFPLAAAPQVVSDAVGVTVDIGSATLRHRTPVYYPTAAQAKRIEGTVTVEVTFDANSNVVDARAISGPEELRAPALESVLKWHFANEAAGNKRQIAFTFRLPAQGPSSSVSIVEPAPAPVSSAGRTVRSIRVLGLSDSAREELLARLPVRVGSTVSEDDYKALVRAVKDYDEHLVVGAVGSGSEITYTIVAPSPNATPTAAAQPTMTTTSDGPAIKVGGNLQSTKLIRQPRPIYPPDAKAARIQGVVRLMAVIGKDGTVKQIEVISGHPLLVPAALDSVKNWVYETTLLNGEPVAVQTQIDVNFTLSQ